MTQISPRHARDLSDHFARLHRRETIAGLRRSGVEILCAIGLVILAAAAGWLAATPITCAMPVQIDVN